MMTPRWPSAFGWFCPIRPADNRMTLNVPTVFICEMHTEGYYNVGTQAARHSLLTIKTLVKSSNRCGAFLLKLYVLKATPVPAQFTLTSKRPNLFFVSPMALVTSASLVTSTGTNSTLSPSSLATSCPRDVDKSASTTLAPFFANRSTVARPRPDAPPVISATVFCGFFKENGVSSA